MDVISDAAGERLLRVRDVQPKELTVSKSDSARSVHFNGILVVLPDLDDLARLTYLGLLR